MSEQTDPTNATNAFEATEMLQSLKVTEVYCTLQVEGLHHWPDCPLEEVAYLRDPHRHMFHIKASKRVSHNDRDVEFIVLKHQIKNYIADRYYDHDKHLCVFGAMSCEMIAQELIDAFGLSMCDVSEDGENGAIVTKEWMWD